eukprot:scaffold204757_cov20-Tisochrysis_lutea.AAC.1
MVSLALIATEEKLSFALGTTGMPHTMCALLLYMHTVLSLPLVNLDTTEKVLYIVGVNHEEAGMAAFVNIAPTD